VRPPGTPLPSARKEARTPTTERSQISLCFPLQTFVIGK
jgi:hypothetical protein